MATVPLRPKPPNDEKLCAACGRRMTWRPAWARTWETVKFCSDGCRKRRPNQIDTELETTLLALLSERARGATLCPSEASQKVFGAEKGLTAPMMERTRCAARRLIANNQLVMMQKGRVVDASTAKGPVRLRLKK